MILMCVVEIDLSVATKLNKNVMESLDVIMKIVKIFHSDIVDEREGILD